LEETSTWSGIPQQYRNDMGGWKFTDDGYGPGIAMDLGTWKSILMTNEKELKGVYAVTKLSGFRAPRLELNDAGLNALSTFKYYDENLEETMGEGQVAAATMADTAGKKGFNWIPWPYTLDHGSPGVWQQQW